MRHDVRVKGLMCVRVNGTCDSKSHTENFISIYESVWCLEEDMTHSNQWIVIFRVP